MSIQRLGQFLEFIGEDGLRTIVKISSIQVAAESDPTGSEILMTAANKSFRMMARLDELREALMEDARYSPTSRS